MSKPIEVVGRLIATDVGSIGYLAEVEVCPCCKRTRTWHLYNLPEAWWDHTVKVTVELCPPTVITPRSEAE